MTECPICDYHYSEKRSHCPCCGSAFIYVNGQKMIWQWSDNGSLMQRVGIAEGIERARQLPQAPRGFQLVN